MITTRGVTKTQQKQNGNETNTMLIILIEHKLDSNHVLCAKWSYLMNFYECLVVFFIVHLLTSC